jgi:hypothetical protein
MNQYQFLKQLGNIPTPGGDGVRVTKSFGPYDFSLATGLAITGATAPSIGNTETNAIALTAAASSALLGSLVVEVPKDYDTVADEFKINLLVVSGGTTNTPVLNASVYRKRAGVALTAALTTVASAAIPISTAFAAERTISVSGNSLQPGDVLTINLTAGAHTTDSVILYNAEVQYKSSIVFSNFNARTA